MQPCGAQSMSPSCCFFFFGRPSDPSRPSHLLSSLFNGCNQKAKVHRARATILKSRLDFTPVCIRQVRNPGLDFSRRPPLEPRHICERLSGFYLVRGTTWAPWSRDICERLSGFYGVLDTTWASWSRDTCERLRGFYFGLGTTWAS